MSIVLAAGCSSQMKPPGQDSMQGQSEKVMKGQEVFMKNCNTCHPAGRKGLGPAIANKPIPGFMIRYQVRKGLGVMPPFDKQHLSEEEMDQLVAFIKEL